MTSRKNITGSSILVIDDHRNIRVSLQLILKDEGAKITEAENCKQALQQIGNLDNPTAFKYDLVLLDIRLPDGSGLEILKKLSEAGLASQVIMISGEGTVQEAFQATQMGAFDYIEKPFVPERLIVSVARCLDFNRVQSVNATLTKTVLKGQEILGNHPAILEMLKIIDRVAPTNGRVLILGESGTGKELVAKAIHRKSERSQKPLIKVNCAAIPHSLIESELFGHEKGAFTGAIKARRGLFEQADGATLFLDEIGELSLDVQSKLLRVLQSGELNRIGSEDIINVDVRLMAATHQDIPEMVRNGEFREDLYYRLNVVTIQVPSLRQRKDDISLLANHFLQLACEEHSLGERTFSQNALEQLQHHHWPGNIRELRNVIERIAILCEEQEIDNVIPYMLSQQSPAKEQSDIAITANSNNDIFQFQSTVLEWQQLHSNLDKAYLKFILQKANGNVSEASRILCLERAYLHRLMKKLGIQREVVVNDE